MGTLPTNPFVNITIADQQANIPPTPTKTTTTAPTVNKTTNRAKDYL